MKTVIPLVLVLVALLPGDAMPAPAPAVVAQPAPAAAAEAPLSDAQLDRLLAPVALYPDTVLTHVLIASTYPLEIVQAARWSREHPDLKGDAAVQAAEQEGWDASVKALVAFPELLARMDEDLQWTQDLGDAFLAQESQLMDRVQHLRGRAEATGHLKTNEHVEVIHEDEVIRVEPVVREVVYVPYYDTRVVYGGWWWPAYPPVYWHAWHGWHRPHFRSVFWWGPAIHVAPLFYVRAFHWRDRHVVVHRHVHVHRHIHRHQTGNRGVHRWRHEPGHRHGVAYRSARVAAAQPGPARAVRAPLTRDAQRQWSTEQRARRSSGPAARTEFHARGPARARPAAHFPDGGPDGRHEARATPAGRATPRRSAAEVQARLESRSRTPEARPQRSSTGARAPEVRPEAAPREATPGRETRERSGKERSGREARSRDTSAKPRAERRHPR